MLMDVHTTHNRPAIAEIGMLKHSAFGNWISGSFTSSAMLAIMPTAAYVYAAGSKPIKKLNPPQPDKDLS